MIIEPWGNIIKKIPNGTDWATAEISHNLIKKIRENIPLSKHRVL